MKFTFFGIVQGLTEFFPVSSSGHLYLLGKFFKVGEEYFSFFVFLHIATLAAILLFFSKSVVLFLDKKILRCIIFATILTAIPGFLIRHLLKEAYISNYLLSFLFLVNAAILLGMKKKEGVKTCRDLTVKDAFWMGILQAVSLLPGISRSGITIVTLTRRGYTKEEAFKVSFFLAIPLMLGVFFLECNSLLVSDISIKNMFLGFILAFIFGLLSLKLLKKMVIGKRFNVFSCYCLVVSLLSLFIH